MTDAEPWKLIITDVVKEAEVSVKVLQLRAEVWSCVMWNVVKKEKQMKREQENENRRFFKYNMFLVPLS